MIRTEEIWDEIERNGFWRYVSKYEIWLKPGELKEFLSNRKVIKESGTRLVYFIIFLYFLTFFAGFGYIYQGVTESRVDRIIVGIIVIIVSVIALHMWITNRFTAMEFILSDGLLTGIPHPKIRKKFGYALTFIPYKYVEGAYLEDFTSDVKRIAIETSDGKRWAANPKDMEGGFMYSKRSVEKYYKIILQQLEAENPEKF